MFLHLWVFLKQFSQKRIQFYVSFISAIYASIKFNTKQFKSNESHGDLERVHQTLKKVWWKHFDYSQTNWDNGVGMLLFAVRKAFQESLGFSPFELVLNTMFEVTFESKMPLWKYVISILFYLEYFRHKFTRACEIEQDNLKQNQAKMKQWYLKDAMHREFKSGDKVIVIKLLCYCFFVVIHYKLYIVAHM